MVEIIEQEEEKMRIKRCGFSVVAGMVWNTGKYSGLCSRMSGISILGGYMQRHTARLYHFEGNQPLYRGNICNGRAKRIPSNGDWS